MAGIGTFALRAPLWQWPGNAAWHFVTLPVDIGHDIQDLSQGLRRGFGSVRVEASVGTTTWRTSLFPDAASGSFVLPVKKAVRTAQGLVVGSQADVRLTLLDL